jgi:methylmalonyl-CoA/ethylmalonyl-CoA epimerase
MKLGRLNHIGVATPSIADSLAYYREVMGAVKISEPFDMPEQGVKVCFVDTPGANEALDGGLNGTQIELIEPLSETSPIHGFLEKNPLGGQHHLCYEVADIDEARAWFEGLGKRILGPTRIGAHGTPMFFLHPKDMMGQLTEIMETPQGGGH